MGLVVVPVEFYLCVYIFKFLNGLNQLKKSAPSAVDNDSIPKYNPELAIPVVLSKTGRYDKSRGKNGCAIILNFEEFQDVERYPKRKGSQRDVDRLVKNFGELNIDIGNRVYKNLTYDKMQGRLTECKYPFLEN